ncbi:MAG: hypothetical protein U0414_18300 [Polyangiaceae bacterium]
MVDVAWQGGGAARVSTLTGEAIVVVSEKPFAPGARPAGALASGHEIRMKVHRCRRVGDAFEIEGRLIDATRALREELARQLGTG